MERWDYFFWVLDVFQYQVSRHIDFKTATICKDFLMDSWTSSSDDDDDCFDYWHCEAAGPLRHRKILHINRRFPLTGDIYNDLRNMELLFPSSGIDKKYIHAMTSTLVEGEWKRPVYDYCKVNYCELYGMDEIIFRFNWGVPRIFSNKYVLPADKRLGEYLQLCAAEKAGKGGLAFSQMLYYYDRVTYYQRHYLRLVDHNCWDTVYNLFKQDEKEDEKENRNRFSYLEEKSIDYEEEYCRKHKQFWF